MNAASRVRLLGDLAEQMLVAITGIQRQRGGEAPGAAEFRAWYEKSRQAGGEEKNLRESLFERKDGRITQVNEASAHILAQKYPQTLSGLCEVFSKEANPETQSFALAQAVADARLSKEMKVQILASFAQRGSLEHQRAVLQTLAPLDPAKCAEILLPIIRKLPADSAGPYWTCPEAALTHCVMLLEDDQVWSEYLRAAKKSSVGLRMEMMNPMNYDYIGQKNRARRLAFIAVFLSDTTVREKPQDDEHPKYSGPCAGFTYKKITVRDFATEKLASILDLPEAPDEFWKPAQWAALRQKVERKLASEKVPKL